MILDFFSHKIHSSGVEWPDKLVELATIFAEFDGCAFDRKAIELRLQKISPRASYLAQSAASKSKRKDESKFRDEISAYPAYLGLYYLKQSSAGWTVQLSETAKRFLIGEAPDVGAFLRLQLPLFQYPNAMGGVYTSRNRVHMQHKASIRTLGFIREGFHLSPVRTIAAALKADAEMRNQSETNAVVSFREIFALANSPAINCAALPSKDEVIAVLTALREGALEFAEKHEKRFHLLKHSEIFVVERGCVRLRKSINEADKNQLIGQLDAIASIDNVFDKLDGCTSKKQLESVVASGDWGRYFDGLKVLPAHVVDALTNDNAFDAAVPIGAGVGGKKLAEPALIAEIYPFRERTGMLPAAKPYDRREAYADPDITKIKRQKRNLEHKELIDKMETWLRRLGARPKETDHIDLFAKIPGDGSFLFEMKSGGDSLLEQIRKGLSQLYEYRYRYRNQDPLSGTDVSLCLVLPEDPTNIPWVIDYLCSDRKINICWFEDGRPIWPSVCAENMASLQQKT